MDRYDDYTPKIFYGDEMRGDENVAPSTPINESSKERKKRVTSNKANKSAKKIRNNVEKSSSLVSNTRNLLASRTTSVVIGIIFTGLAAYFLISFVSYIGTCLSDQSVIYNNAIGSVPDVANKGGEGGARLSEFFINGGFGLGAFVLIIWLICMSLKFLIGQPRFKTLDFTLKCLIGFITLSLIVGLFTIGSNTIINWGGYHGRYVNEWIIGFLGWWGAVILCLMMVALFVAICMRDVVKWIINKKKILDIKRRELLEKRAREKAKAQNLEEHKRKEMELESAGISNEDNSDVDTEDVDFTATTLYPESLEEVESSWQVDGLDEDASSSYMLPHEDEEDGEKSLNAQSLSSMVGTGDTAPVNISDEKEPASEMPMVVNVNQIAKADDIKEYSFHKKSMYRFPSLALLKETENKISVNEHEQLANQEKIRQTLLDYGVPIVSIEAHVGPTVTLYEIKPDKGNRISRIKGLADEIAMSLAAIGVRIIAPIPGRGTIGIEVANLNRQAVSLRSILESRKYQETKADLPLALGSTISNEVYIADLASMPHLLVAGTTGQGKSVGLNVIIMSLLFKKRPEELKFVMFDPKQVEFDVYASIQKQYLAKLPEEEEAIVTDMNKVVPTLNSLCIEMDNRYSLLKQAEVRKLEEYNKLVKAGKLDNAVHKLLPYIVVVVDEFADLIMMAGKEVEMPIARLAQKARAVGIHVIIATQRPSTTVITGNIRTNFLGRIAFKVSNGIDSKVILDTTGAQQLIGKGDMLISNNSELVRVQCAYVDTQEIKDICEHVSAQPYPPDSPYILPEPTSSDGASGDGSGSMASSVDKDPLYDEIRSYVIMSGIASTSNIQRKFQLGYNRAGRIMDQLEAEGVVGPSQGGKARSVLVSA